MTKQPLPDTRYNFKIIEKKNLWFMISLLIIIFGLSSMGMRALKGDSFLNFGIDFVGGTSMILKFDKLDQLYEESQGITTLRKDINISFIEDLRSSLTNFGLEKSKIQITQDNEVIIKTTQLTTDKNLLLREALQAEFGLFEVLEIDFIGPSIGQELRQTSIWIILTVSFALLLYITWRFEFAFGLAALLAVGHDALITLSIASLLLIEVDTAFVAAILTILGYSINDTIVVFDRIRENKKALKKSNASLKILANLSINQTLLRTINTSVTTLFVITCLMFLGGTTTRMFCFVLFVGIISGTYSSIFIASPLLVQFNKTSET